jgi:hypothetical protein
MSLLERKIGLSNARPPLPCYMKSEIKTACLLIEELVPFVPKSRKRREWREAELVNLTVVTVLAINGWSRLARSGRAWSIRQSRQTVVVFNRVPNARATQLDNWIWGLSLTALTIAIHATGVTFMVAVLHNIRVRLETRGLRLLELIAIVISAITVMGLLLTALHGIEAALWAAVYLWVGALGSPEAAILYSLDTMATRGASGLVLQPPWQMLGPLEAADGMLLFGISTAFIFTVMQFYYQRLVLRTPADRAARAE